MMIKRSLSRAWALPMALFAASCMSDSNSGDGGKSGGTAAAAGVFTVTLMPATSISSAYTSVLGAVLDGEPPSPLAWKEAAAGGACKLYTPRAPFCSPGCGSGSICVEDNVCKAEPDAVPVGVVTVKGIKTKDGAATFAMSPLLNSYQPPAGTQLAFPPFAEGDAVTVSAAGADSIPAFTVSAKGIAPLAVLTDSLVLDSGKAMEIKWTPAAQASASSVHAMVDISHHGGTKGKIECETSDAGSLTIPAALLSQLKALGVAGFPKVELARIAKGTNADVGVDLVLQSPVTKDIHIPGLVSCSADEDCPTGKTCQADMQCK